MTTAEVREALERYGSVALRVTGNASSLEPSERRCTCCGERLSRRIAWLELDQRVNRYHDIGDIPVEHSQGWHVFGLACARRLKREGLQALLEAASKQELDTCRR